jgi:hypothetical protein
MNPLLILEQSVLAQGREWTRQRLETQAQKEVNDWGNLCPQSQELLKYRKRQPLKVMTCAGLIVLKTWRGYSAALGRWVNPARQRWGLQPKQRVSPELQSRLGFTATATGSYQKAAQTATRWGSPVSDDLIHAVVQRLGAQSAQLTLPEPQRATGEPEFSLVIMMDGWMVRQRGRDWGAGPRKKAADRVNWKEVKAAVIYRLEQRVEKDSGRGMLLEKFVVAAPPETDPVDFGAAVQTEARRRGLGRARKVYVVIDGAVWLWNVREDRFRDAIALLDFHHASEHLWAIAHLLHGQGSPQGRAWVEPLLHQLRHGKEEKVVRTLESLLQPKAGLAKKTRAALRVPVEYFQTHREHLHYQKVARQGGPIGSGPVESFNSQLQDRFKRTGQFWQPPGLRHLLAVDVLLRNNDYNALWN